MCDSYKGGGRTRENRKENLESYAQLTIGGAGKGDVFR